MKQLFGTALLAATLLGAPALAQKPQYGGNLEIGTVSATISALSWDPADFAWKLNHDTGLYLETLFAGDLGKSLRNGGKFNFKPDAWLSLEAMRQRLIPVLGIAFIGDAHPDTEQIIVEMGGVRSLGRLPRLDPLTPGALRRSFQAHFDISLFRTMKT